MAIVNVDHILNNPTTAELPATEFEELNAVTSLAGTTTESNFAAAKTYMMRLDVRLQVLFLMLVVRALPIQHPLKHSPKYIEWYADRDLQNFICRK